MNLWWPRSVPYCNNTGSCNKGDCLAGKNPKVQIASACGQTVPDLVGTATAATSVSSTIYSKPLKSTEIRLAVLSTAESPDFPVHLDLEIYELDDCPEYEAVSYLWGGENDDTTPCCPIYVGPFWYVLFQTKNCWDMLRFMRPWRGVRMVWVDAVCINQEDVPERSQQVANMSRIYSGCTRVIVYLGSDIATPLNGRHPRRHPLRDLESGSAVPSFSGHQQPKLPLTLTRLLERRYFSRIWVIQELLLPCHVLMRIGDIDFWADGSTAKQISDLYTSLAWSDSAAEWFGHMCRAVQFEKNISRLLGMTSNAEATDPRDRVFGLLGIAQAENDLSLHSQDRGLQADYSLSCQHVFIGMFAHCLLNSGRDQILYAARGTKACNGCPSWVPEWGTQEELRHAFGSPDFKDEGYVQLVMAMKLHRKLVPERYTFEAYRLQNRWAYAPVKLEDHVCSHTGALYINVIQYMPIKSQPVRIGKHDQYHIFRIRPHRMHPVYIFSSHLLDELDFLGSEQVFVYNSSLYPQNLVYLILHPVIGIHNSFQLIAACPQIVIGEVKANDSKRSTLRRQPYRYKTLSFSDLRASWRCTLKEVKELCKEKLDFTGSGEKHWLIRLLFPHAFLVGDLLEPCGRLADTEEIEQPVSHLTLGTTLTDIYIYFRIYDVMESVVLESAYVVFTFKQHAWRKHKLWERFIQPGQLNDIWEFGTEILEWTFDPSAIREDQGRSLGDWVKVRCRGWNLIDAFSKANQQLRTLWSDLRALRHVSAHTGESISEMLEREPREEDEYIGCPPWSSHPSILHNMALCTALGIAGGSRIVKIV
ncbi:heterokaryon incompatibility protein HET-6-like protein [Colletotrichum kahawae]|uniref:Heterokaryon incompatibility protein HET-6-like protein n=1 Tax=Colletotrichum kahawae TaxID=34407 RepID=A0AAD9Y9F7_COLKA|nr:heterokaryon incompatibility protein HET-6-like protein [Colletotrichum kahawae]